jgi:hypothetical protein
MPAKASATAAGVPDTGVAGGKIDLASRAGSA